MEPWKYRVGGTLSRIFELRGSKILEKLAYIGYAGILFVLPVSIHSPDKQRLDARVHWLFLLLYFFVPVDLSVKI